MFAFIQFGPISKSFFLGLKKVCNTDKFDILSRLDGGGLRVKEN
jgi:hypothetical protein